MGESPQVSKSAFAPSGSGVVSHRDDRLRTGFYLLTSTDLLARTGYQMGKSPVLPLFVSALGAGSELSGITVAISTLTGLLASPLIGTLSDLYGRGRLLLAGTTIFAVLPFLYLFVETVEQLFIIRLIHGFGTAIYGPVLAALVADMFSQRRAKYMGWYRAVRTASYLLGPLLGGVVLFFGDFRLAWVSIGALGLLAFLPALALTRGNPVAPLTTRRKAVSWAAFGQHLSHAFKDPLLVALGIAQAALYLGLRANKAFFPIYALTGGANPAQIGALLSAQVAVTMLAQPACGTFSDRMGRRLAILLGLLFVACGLPLMVMTGNLALLAALCVLLGIGEALVMPAILTLGTELTAGERYGSTLGMLDAMDNVGKALGPIAAGLLLSWFNYAAAFAIIAALLILVAITFFALVQSLD